MLVAINVIARNPQHNGCVKHLVFMTDIIHRSNYETCILKPQLNESRLEERLIGRALKIRRKYRKSGFLCISRYRSRVHGTQWKFAE